MLITSPQGQRELDHWPEFLILTSSDPMMHFRTMRTILEMLRCWLKGLLIRRLFLKHKSLNGLPPRIGTIFFPTLMMHTRTWWKSFMLMPFLKEMSSNVRLRERVYQWHLFTLQRSYASTGRCFQNHRYMTTWIWKRKFFEKP